MFLSLENARLTPSIINLANKVIPQICPLWREVGIQLNLDITILNEIRANHHGDVRQCCTRMFEEWLKQDTETTWLTVLSACSTVKQNLLLCQDEPHTKDYIKALNKLTTTLPVFLESL